MSITTNSGERWNNAYTPAERLEVTFGVFFDGTLNNIKNIEARGIYEEYKEQYEQHIEENGKNDKKILSDVFGNDNEKKTAYEAYEKYRSKEVIEGTLERDGYDYRTRPDDVSYENDYTNPARLFKLTKDEDYRIYIEGSGSLNYQEDRMSGMAFGSEESGVRAKVRKGCEELAKKIAKKHENKKNASVIYVNIDTYGFSRGAAGARNFIHEITRTDGIKEITRENNILKVVLKKKSLKNSRGDNATTEEIKEIRTASDKQKYYKADEYTMPKGFLGYYLKYIHGIDIQEIKLVVRVRFAGLYDTVSSYGEIAGFIPQFANDIKELKLHEVSEHAKYVLHLTAKDEWRVNFALTQLRATNRYHRELSLVGSHADVGGSYIDNADERKFVYWASNNKDLENRIAKYEEWGWFKRHERLIGDIKYTKGTPNCHGETIDTYTIHPFGTKLFYKRRELSHKYSYITLHLMSRYMDYFGVDIEGSPVIDPDSLEEDYSLNLTAHFTVAEMLKMIRDNLQTLLDQTEVSIRNTKKNLYLVKCQGRWKDYIHKGLVKLLQGDFLTHYYITLDDPLLYMKKIILEHNYEQATIKECTVLRVRELLRPYKYFEDLKKNKDEFASVLCHQFYLRWLRNRFLHHSADEHTSAGMDVPLITILRAHRGRYSNGEPNRQTYI